MAKVRNILFIMCDQLRRDYLSCYGHPTLPTSHIDALAAQGTRFTQAYVQGPVCGPSRMSTYTGRYVSSHGATWNFVPLSVQIPTLGDYMRSAGLRTAVIGKTHVLPDLAGLHRLSLLATEGLGQRLAEGGFDPFARHDGIITDSKALQSQAVYNQYLLQNGYKGINPWHEFANSALDENGHLQSGWSMRNAHLPARVQESHSETAWCTDQALQFIQTQGDSPWCLHLSYIKPHWPYIAPAPYHQRFGAQDVKAPVRKEHERTDTHPVYKAFRNHVESQSFAQQSVREHVIPTYMGLVQQIDDHIGRLMAGLKAQGRLQDTLIVFTSDHGDLLGDHWLGEKEMFYEASAGIPLIIVDPSLSHQVGVCDALVESIDLLPTFIEALGQPAQQQWLEGQSLVPFLQKTEPGKEAVFSELDYAFYPAAKELQVPVNEARATMVRTQRWKLVDYQGFEPQLFDLQEDPDELTDQGQSAEHASLRADLKDLIHQWRSKLRIRTSMSDAQAEQLAARRNAMKDIVIGQW